MKNEQSSITLSERSIPKTINAIITKKNSNSFVIYKDFVYPVSVVQNLYSKVFWKQFVQ